MSAPRFLRLGFVLSFSLFGMSGAVAADPSDSVAEQAPPSAAPVADETWEDRLEAAGAGFNTVMDVAVLRPLGGARLLIGGAVILPISSLVNALAFPVERDPNVFVADWDRYVVEPAEYVFSRPIGEDLMGG
jgi:hypothetical protein